MKLHKSTFVRILIIVIVLVFTLLSYSNYFHDEASEILTIANSKIAESSKFIFDLKKGISFFSSSKIPLIKGYAQVSLTDLNKISSYLTVSQVLLKLQLLILKLANFKLLKILPLLLCVGLFLNRFKLIALKLIIVCLFLSPGLSLFTHVIHDITEAINNKKLGVDLHQKIETTKEAFFKKEEQLKIHQKNIQNQQLLNAEAAGKKRISAFKRLQDKVVNVVEKTALKIKEDTQLIEEVILINTEKLLLHLIQFLSSLLLLVVILPLLYFYGIKKLIQKIFSFNIESFLNQLITKNNS